MTVRPEGPLAIVLLKPGAQRKPLLVMPDIGGNLLYARLIVQHLTDDRPVMGLRLPGNLTTDARLGTLSALGMTLVESIRTSGAEEPHHLVGHSFAGLLAYETARLLRADGARVGVVALIDTPAPPRPLYRPLRRARRALAALKRGKWPVRSLPDTLSEPGFASFDLAGRPEALRAVIRTLYGAMIVYRPNPSDLHLTVLRADADDPGDAEDLGWVRLVGRNVTTVAIPGNHLSITVEAEPAARIAQVLQAAMAQAEDVA